MSSTYASPTPSQVPRSPPLPKSLDVPSTIHGSEPPTDSTEPLKDTSTAPSASQDAPLTPPSAVPLPQEAEVAPHDDPPSEKMREGHAVDFNSQSEEVAVEPALVASSNPNALGSVSATEPSSNADRPSGGDGDDGSSQENGTVNGEMDARVASESSVSPAKQAKQNGHAQCDGQPQLEATVMEISVQSPADTTLAPFLDETTAYTTETTIMPSLPSTEGLNGSGGTETGEEAPEYAIVAHEDAFVSEAVPASGHDSAVDGHDVENPAKTEVPADITPIPMPNETVGDSEVDAPLSSQQDPAKSLDETLTAVPIADRAKEGSTDDPSQPPTGDQDRALPPSAETTEIATSQSVEPVTQAAEPPPSSDPAFATVDKGSELVVPPHGQAEVEEQAELDSIATGESKEESLPTAVDVGNSTSAPQCQESAMKEPDQAAPSEQEKGTARAASMHEAPTQAATDAQDPASAEAAENIPAQSVELASSTPDPQVNTTDPVLPSLPLVDRPEATNDQLDLVEASAAAPPPEELAVDVQVEAGQRELGGIPMEDGDDHAQPIADANPAQREVKQEEAVELTEGGMYWLSYFASSSR